jgi:hypothetical protein
MCDESIGDAIEVTAASSAHATIILTPAPKSEVIQPVANDETIDDRKAPAVFRSIWREFISLLTLAIAPGLNVRLLLWCI